MKLSVKLTLFITGSKLVIVLIFITALPFLVKEIASQYTNYTLKQQKSKVISIVNKKGLDYYLQGDDNYGSYTLLKEEFIAFVPVKEKVNIDTIKDARRIIEGDTLNYRILSHTFRNNSKNYLLEIGKTTNSIERYNKPLQRFALWVLVGLVALSILIDLTFIRVLLRPLTMIIKSKLINRKFPFKKGQKRVPTSTSDFRYLDESLMMLMRQIDEAFDKEREFTSNASHELMTPISILQNKLENLLNDEQTSEASALAVVETMKTVDRLKNITRSLLLISRIENEQFIRNDKVVLRTLFDDIIEEIRHRLEEKDLNILVEIDPGVELHDVNKDLLSQLFFNLIHNAIKFNRDKGTIFIKGFYGEQGRYELTIRDTGIGIPAEDLPFIFDRFRKTNLHSHVGYGLGLAIVKSIALYHQIHINVESRVGEGTAFRLIFDDRKSG
ncbi:sensor histidine kinase [Pararcticibacter amylolyticus]|uniref:histidine kinase n=1 Tax=Pararcticibacter amylolyticus TaxID=2173175 RepID=A0A2U2PD18_9SPHI|nr:HAMP domain-containing sensor histidine kinase [Pararcticibacter amylolyticus]PWG79250.1 two-component sensor histidine kinase [Pararcticibacter amylolyticus]